MHCPRLSFRPRILYLCRSATLMHEQLQGPQMLAAQVLANGRGVLRDDISTDEISPLPAMVHFDAALGRYPYTGFKAGADMPVGRDRIAQCGFEVVVAGRRYGKGSSREHAVVAEMAAGVRLVIAESFERIYRQNADNLGLYTATDFGLVERIERGEAIGLDELLRGRDDLAADILRHGGLLKYGRARFGERKPDGSGTRDAPTNASTNAPTTPNPRSIWVTTSTRSVAVDPRGSSPVRRTPTTRGIGM